MMSTDDHGDVGGCISTNDQCIIGAVTTTAPGGGAPTATLKIAEGNAAVYGFTASDETNVYWSITGRAQQDLFSSIRTAERCHLRRLIPTAMQ